MNDFARSIIENSFLPIYDLFDRREDEYFLALQLKNLTWWKSRWILFLRDATLSMEMAYKKFGMDNEEIYSYIAKGLRYIEIDGKTYFHPVEVLTYALWFGDETKCPRN